MGVEERRRLLTASSVASAVTRDDRARAIQEGVVTRWDRRIERSGNIKSFRRYHQGPTEAEADHSEEPVIGNASSYGLDIRAESGQVVNDDDTLADYPILFSPETRNRLNSPLLQITTELVAKAQSES